MIRTKVTRGVIGAASVLLAPPLLALSRLRDVAPILLYHRVSPVPDAAYPPLSALAFDEHCDFLARQFRVIRLRELIDRALRGVSIRGCCAISFDDGYKDFREHALPILRRRGLPVTHFLVADCVEDGLPPWTYRLNRIGAARRWSSGEAREKHLLLGRIDAPGRAAWLAEEEDRASLSSETLPPMLRAEDVRAIDPELVEWGSHTASHGFIDRLPEHEVVREVEGSRRRLEAVTGADVRLLAYPNGHHGGGAERAAEKAGYESALTVDEAFVTPRSPRFAVPRFDVGGHPTRMLKLEATGLLGALRRARSS